jgi:hypothetical protein
MVPFIPRIPIFAGQLAARLLIHLSKFFKEAQCAKLFSLPFFLQRVL